ncbi:MAG: phosphoribosyltransferase family protein [Clostridiales bacterium]|jgi:hypothetical protein|nr:phosphoribosyltransferase family protein [Clostridiales bacterium]
MEISDIDKSENFALAARRGNTRRPYLIVNRLQAKHLPADPDDALQYFHRLGELVKKSLSSGERVFVIGFAETATAIGAAVAERLPGAYYCQTTRERLPEEFLIARFSEEHSHAAAQALFCSLPREEFREFDRIIFVEDEVTTGQTIDNSLSALLKSKVFKDSIKVSVASLLDGINKSAINYPVSYFYLDKRTDPNLAEKARKYADLPPTPFEPFEPNENPLEIIEIGGRPHPNLGVWAEEYRASCEKLADTLKPMCARREGDMLIIGTEEFMYPALLAGSGVKSRFARVSVQATTRSPILPAPLPCPINEACALSSLYENGRETFIYNLRKYDEVIILTDSPCEAQGLRDLHGALGRYGNHRIKIFKWTD